MLPSTNVMQCNVNVKIKVTLHETESVTGAPYKVAVLHGSHLATVRQLSRQTGHSVKSNNYHGRLNLMGYGSASITHQMMANHWETNSSPCGQFPLPCSVRVRSRSVVSRVRVGQVYGFGGECPGAKMDHLTHSGQLCRTALTCIRSMDD